MEDELVKIENNLASIVIDFNIWGQLWKKIKIGILNFLL